MADTILPKKTVIEIPIATNDVAHAQLVADPAVNQFQATNVPYPLPVVAPVAVAPAVIQPPVQPAPVVQSPAPISTISSVSGTDTLIANSNEHWINGRWRPAMGWMYMAVCITDFMLFPILWSMLQAYSHGSVTTQWQPLTLQGAGLFHLAMGAVLGIAAYGRTKEKLGDKI